MATLMQTGQWAGSREDRKSISGYVMKIVGAALSWSSRKQSCVALSTLVVPLRKL